MNKALLLLTVVAVVLLILWISIEKEPGPTTVSKSSEQTQISKSQNQPADSSAVKHHDGIIANKPLRESRMEEPESPQNLSSFATVLQDYLYAQFCDEINEKYGHSFIHSKASPYFDDLRKIYTTDFIRNGLWNNKINQCLKLVNTYQLDSMSLTKQMAEMAPEVLKVLYENEPGSPYETEVINTLKIVGSYKELIIKKQELEWMSSEIERIKNSEKNYQELKQIVSEFESERGYRYLTGKLSDIFYQSHSFEEFSSAADQLIAEANSQALSSEIEKVKNQLLDRLPQSNDTEFYLITKFFPAGLETLSPSEESPNLKSSSFNSTLYFQSGINDTEYYNHLVNPVMDRFVCLKGFDCSRDSVITLSYCFGLWHRERIDEACQMDFQDVYSSHLLSTNQQSDAEIFLQNLTHAYD